MDPEQSDALGLSDSDAGLRPAEELVTAEGDDVGALMDRVADRELLSKSEAGRVEEGAAPKIVDERDVVLAREGRELTPLRTRDETRDLEVARVHAEDRAGPLADRGRVIARVRAVRRAHLDELRSRATEHIRNAEAAADLDQLAARHDDLLARGKRGESEEDRRGVVVHHDRVLRRCEVGEEASGVSVAFAALSGDEVVLDAYGAGGRGDCRERSRRERRAPEVRLQDDSRRVDDAPQREALTFDERRARLGGECRRIAGDALGARAGQHLARGSSEALALVRGRPSRAKDRIDRWQGAARVGTLHRPRTSRAPGRTRIENRSAVVVSPSSCARIGRCSSISITRARFITIFFPSTCVPR